MKKRKMRIAALLLLCLLAGMLGMLTGCRAPQSDVFSLEVTFDESGEFVVGDALVFAAILNNAGRGITVTYGENIIEYQLYRNGMGLLVHNTPLGQMRLKGHGIAAETEESFTLTEAGDYELYVYAKFNLKSGTKTACLIEHERIAFQVKG